MQQELTMMPEIKVTVRREMGRVLNTFTFVHSKLNLE